MYGRSRSVFVLAFVCGFSQLSFAEEFTQPVWPDGVPNANGSAEKEAVTNRGHDQNELGLNRSISHVSQPSLTVMLPHESRATGVAVMVFPGGAFSRIVIDKEGLDVGRWLATQGIAAVVVKYRTGHYGDPRQVADAQQVLHLVRDHAREWGIDPARVGAMGFSAGGYIAAALCMAESGAGVAGGNMPAFLACIYSIYPDNIGEFAADFPPTFMLYANDDGSDIVEQNMQLMQQLNTAIIEVYAHAFGGHGFGLGIRGGSVASWPGAFAVWLQGVGLLETARE